MDRLIDFVIEMWKLAIGAVLVLLVSLWFIMGWMQYQLCRVSHFGWCDHTGTNSAVVILMVMLAVAGWVVVKLFKRFPKVMIALSLAASVPAMALVMLAQDVYEHPTKVQAVSEVPAKVEEPITFNEPALVHPKYTEFDVPEQSVAPVAPVTHLAPVEVPVAPEVVTAQPQEELTEAPVVETPEPIVTPVAKAPYGSPEWMQQDPNLPPEMKKMLACQIAQLKHRQCAP